MLSFAHFDDGLLSDVWLDRVGAYCRKSKQSSKSQDDVDQYKREGKTHVIPTM